MMMVLHTMPSSDVQSHRTSMLIEDRPDPIRIQVLRKQEEERSGEVK